MPDYGSCERGSFTRHLSFPFSSGDNAKDRVMVPKMTRRIMNHKAKSRIALFSASIDHRRENACCTASYHTVTPSVQSVPTHNDSIE